MTITIQTKSGVFEVPTTDDDIPVLFAGLAAGLTLPYECATGTCGTCRARVMSGSYEMAWKEAPGAQRLKLDKGDVLMCQCRAQAGCVLRVPAQVSQTDGEAPKVLSGRIVELRPLTEDVVHFEVELAEPCAFAAGQFVVVSAPGFTGGRAYSMVNYVPETDRLAFVVKRKPGGGFSEWLFGGSRLEAEIQLFGPLGAATFRPDSDGDLICITGGSGIAGIMSILDHAVSSGHFNRHRGQLFFGVRTLADAFYLDELRGFVDKSGGALGVTLALSHEEIDGGRHPNHPSIRLAHGFVHDVAGRALADDAGDDYFVDKGPQTVGFLAGPPPMVDAGVRVLLTEAGLTPGQVRYDKFG